MKKLMMATVGMVGMVSAAKAETIDVMMLYTQPAADKISGSMSTRINNLISYANRVYRNNGLDITLNVVAQGRISTSDLQPTESDLDLITDSNSIQGYRNQYKADMVVLLGTRENIFQGGQLQGYVCGIAWVGRGNNGTMYSSSNSRAYSISAVDCGYNTFVHELGHNMGLAHSRRQGDRSGGVYSYGMGHGVDFSFSTIMAYPQAYNGNVTQLDIFSDPDWNACNSQPCGVTGVSNSYQAIRPIIDDVAGYR
ncbi:zinc-dependent metalloprotease family protein [Pleionea sp. CnH1-48]|uniref:zinc-dependent metalloprotease family protein n=1 Tax=Pleionea sp. CnH1-48 TaxID=2954494 RepID=UPI002096C578|nr:zinc-dependent metalloprotease family protein [Pleionea sp. CnH1-48]MCO7226348.1 M12 family metallo-peptidase [Pleionea sp. CnH1-48]